MKRLLNVVLCFSVILSIVLGSIAYASDIGVQAVVVNEKTGDNGSMSTAQLIHEDYTVLGTISSATDVDYYKIVIPETGKANFWLGDIPSGYDYDLNVLNSSGTIIYSATTTNPYGYELIENKSVAKGQTLYIKVSSKSGSNTSLKYRLRVKVQLSSYTYFCQKDTGSGFNFPYTNLDITYLKYVYNGSNYLCTFKDDIHDAGCAICSYAMILRNLNKYTTTSYRDIRYGVNSTKTTRIADPVSVCYANVGFPEAINYAENPGKYLINTGTSAVLTNYLNIGNGFGVSIKRVELGSYTETNKMNNVAKYLVNHPEGICAYFNNTSYGGHMIVIKNTTYEAPESFVVQQASPLSQFMYDDVAHISDEQMAKSESKVRVQSFTNGDKFVAYDPARSKDNGVLLSETWTATGGGYSWSNLQYICYIDD